MDLSTLMRRIQQGDREAFATLYTRYNKTVYRVALDATHDSAEAVQVVIAVFREMYQTIRSKGPYLGDLYGWLDALTAKQIRLRRVMGGSSPKPSAPSRTAAAEHEFPARMSTASPSRSFSQEEAAALQERALARLQRGEAPFAAAAEPERPPAHTDTERPSRKTVKKPNPVPAAIMDEEDEEEYEEAAASSRKGGAFSVAVLSLTALALLWVLVGLLGTLGILPQWPLGYAWFNQTLFPLF